MPKRAVTRRGGEGERRVRASPPLAPSLSARVWADPESPAIRSRQPRIAPRRREGPRMLRKSGRWERGAEGSAGRGPVGSGWRGRVGKCAAVGNGGGGNGGSGTRAGAVRLGSAWRSVAAARCEG